MVELLETIWPTLALLAGVAALILVLRNRATPLDSVERIGQNGQPAVVEVFSNY